MKDNSLKKSKFKSDNENYNLKKELLKERKVDKEFLEKLNFLTLEDLITLKLDSASKSLKGKLFNFPILKYATDICQEAVIKYGKSKKLDDSLLIQGPLEEVNFKKNYVDLIICTEVLEHLVDDNAVIQKMNKFLMSDLSIRFISVFEGASRLITAKIY